LGRWSNSRQRLIFFDPNAIVITDQNWEYSWHKEVRHLAQLKEDLLTMHAREMAAIRDEMEKVEIGQEYTENSESEGKSESEDDELSDFPRWNDEDEV